MVKESSKGKYKKYNRETSRNQEQKERWPSSHGKDKKREKYEDEIENEGGEREKEEKTKRKEDRECEDKEEFFPEYEDNQPNREDQI